MVRLNCFEYVFSVLCVWQFITSRSFGTYSVFFFSSFMCWIWGMMSRNGFKTWSIRKSTCMHNANIAWFYMSIALCTSTSIIAMVVVTKATYARRAQYNDVNHTSSIDACSSIFKLVLPHVHPLHWPLTKAMVGWIRPAKYAFFCAILPIGKWGRWGGYKRLTGNGALGVIGVFWVDGGFGDGKLGI